MLRAVTFGHCYFETPLARIAPDSEIHFALLLTITSGALDGVPRDEVVTRLWPRATLDDARHCLRQATYRLRQLAVPVQLRAGRLVLDRSATALDLPGLLHDAPARHELVRLGALEFLPAYTPTLGEAYAHWLEALRARVATRLRRALADEVASARARGRFHEMGQVARLLLSLDPLHELGTMVLAESLALEGSKVEALRLLEQYEAEVGAVNSNLQLPVRVLRRRVSEVFDDSLMLRRLEVPFVGREREFGALRTIWRDVRGGSSCAVILTGEAGIGKTRLAGELMRLAALDGATLASYTTSAGDTFTPLSTLVSVGQLLLSLPGALGCDQEQLAYVRRLGTPETVSAWHVAGMAADVLYAQLVQALAELVAAIAEEAPLLLFVDDAERLHPTTWRVIVDVWDRVGHRGVLFVLAARRLPPWFGSLGVRSCERLTQHVVVRPLAREESHEFLRAWSARTAIPIADDPAETLAVASRGNPFYLTELAMHVGHGGDPQQTPANIRELIGAQYRVLGRGAQRLLLVVAVLEARATTGRVTQVLEMPAADFMAALDEVEEAGLVTTQGPVVRVRHRMVGEVTVALAMPSVVDFVHGRSAALLESEADATASVELLGDCVTHWERAGETRRAYEAAMKLGHRLVGLGMGEEAERAYARAEDIARELAEQVLAIEGRLAALRLAGRWFAVAEAYERRSSKLRKLEIDCTKVDEFYLIALESALWANQAEQSLNPLLAFAGDPTMPPRLRAKAAVVTAMYADNFYDVTMIVRSLEAVQDLQSAKSDEIDKATLQLIFHSSIGDIDRAAELADRLANLTRGSEESWLRIQGLRRAAVGMLRIGRFADAEAALEEVLKDTRRLKIPYQTLATLEQLVDTCMARSNTTKARTHLRELMETPLEVEAEYHILVKSSAAIRVAWQLQDGSVVSDLVGGVFATHKSRTPMVEHNLLTNEAALMMLRDSSAEAAALVPRLLELHLSSRGMGRQDFSSEVLLTALARSGQKSLASSLAAEYATTHRREKGAPPRGIAVLAEIRGERYGHLGGSRRK